jgi:diamine N-acetyltransferase
VTRNIVPLIRRGTAADADLLAEFGARTFSDTFAPSNKPEDIAAYLATAFDPDIQAAELADPCITYLIAETDERMIGYAMLRAGSQSRSVLGPRAIELVRIYVAREWFGFGVGEALMRRCIDEARQAGYQTIWLGVWEHNTRAQAFYRKWNFQITGQHIFKLGSDLQNDFLMERPLS